MIRRGEGREKRAMCHMVHRARGCVFSSARNAKAEPASGLISQEPVLGNERARRYTRNIPGSLTSRQRGAGERRRGNFDPAALTFVNCAREIPILRGRVRLDSLSLSLNRATAESLFEEDILAHRGVYINFLNFPPEFL